MREIDESIIESFKNHLKEDYSVDENVFFFKVSPQKYLQAAEFLNKNGFQRLLTVSAVDWIEKELFEVYFLVHNMIENLYVKIATEIPREDPKIQSLTTIWSNALLHENEVWELFGITFKGNNHLQPLF
ncbi:MAG: NADH-quinone oxidoreductase subunit C, partial [Asgard group archaeon]|nr:NADH-quinone oxidoreductase subunit C [Asgard group archaeon]